MLCNIIHCTQYTLCSDSPPVLIFLSLNAFVFVCGYFMLQQLIDGCWIILEQPQKYFEPEIHGGGRAYGI